MTWINTIRCLVCHGTGWITARDYRGLPYPVKCQGCGGTGQQPVR